MSFKEVYIDKMYEYKANDKVSHEEYNNGFNLLAEAANNSTKGVAEAKEDIEVIQESIDGIVEGMVPDGSITHEKLAPNSVYAENLDSDVNSVVASMKYAQMVQRNLAHMATFQLNQGTSGGRFNNMRIMQSVSYAPTTYTEVLNNVTTVSDSLTVVANKVTSSDQGTYNMMDGSGATIKIAHSREHGVHLSGDTNRYWDYPSSLYLTSQHIPPREFSHLIIRAKYSQKYTPVSPFNETNEIKVVFSLGPSKGNSWISREDMNEAIADAISKGYTPTITIKGLLDGVWHTLKTITTIPSSDTFSEVVTVSSTYSEYVVEYDYTFYFDRSKSYWKKYKNWNYSGGYGVLGESTLTFNQTKLNLFSATVEVETTQVEHTHTSQNVYFRNPSKYITVGFNGNETAYIIVTLYANGQVLQKHVSGNEDRVTNASASEGITYRADFELEEPTQNAVVSFMRLWGDPLEETGFTKYYIVG